MSKHLSVVLEGAELTESAKEKVSSIFEAAVSEAISVKEAELTEKAEKELAEAKQELVEKQEQYIDDVLVPNMTNILSQYVTYAIGEWIEENKVAVVSNWKVDIAESFIKSTKAMVESHNIEIDDKTLERVEESETAVADIKAKLDASVSESIKLKETIEKMERASIIDKACADITESQKEKIVSAASKLTSEDFESKVKDLVESYYPADKTKIEEDVSSDNNNTELNEKVVDPYLDSFTKAYSKK